MKVTESNKCSFCVDVVDFIEHFFFNCPVVHDFWKFIESYFLTELDVKLHLQITDVLFGVKKLNVKKEYLMKINHILLLGKMCISIFKKTNSPFRLKEFFEKQLQIRQL